MDDLTVGDIIDALDRLEPSSVVRFQFEDQDVYLANLTMPLCRGDEILSDPPVVRFLFGPEED